MDVKNNAGVLCTWYEGCTCVFRMSNVGAVYHSIESYICTLTHDCIDTSASTDDSEVSVTCIPFKPTVIPCNTSVIVLNQECDEYILSLIGTQNCNPEFAENITCTVKEKGWVTCGKAVLTSREKMMLCNGKELSDIHIDASQNLLKLQFYDINGLQSMLYQNKQPLKKCDNVLQIMFVNNNHWAVLSTLANVSAVSYYDSAYNKLSVTTQQTIATLLSPSNGQVTVNIMDIAKQKGCTDCGLYAIAVATALAHKIDPVTLVFRQDEMRSHLQECFEKQKLQPFPILKTRRPKLSCISTVVIYICLICRSVDDGSKMVYCEECKNWFHDSCISEYNEDIDWYCSNCL